MPSRPATCLPQRFFPAVETCDDVRMCLRYNICDQSLDIFNNCRSYIFHFYPFTLWKHNGKCLLLYFFFSVHVRLFARNQLRKIRTTDCPTFMMLKALMNARGSLWTTLCPPTLPHSILPMIIKRKMLCKNEVRRVRTDTIRHLNRTRMPLHRRRMFMIDSMSALIQNILTWLPASYINFQGKAKVIISRVVWCLCMRRLSHAWVASHSSDHLFISKLTERQDGLKIFMRIDFAAKLLITR